ncbi:MAG TPA: hypothetical protein VFJ16_07180 [Longimicrobium sp.]|nr:hypothetical protein [Longimicrobium sp.]
MMQTALHPTPRPASVLREQLRALGLALRAPAAAAAVLAAAMALLITLGIVEEGHRIDFYPELSMLPAIAGFLLPLAVWWGEDRFGPGFLWTLPVDRRRHALTRVCAGWMWLMAGVLCFVLWLLALALLTGGNLVGDQTVRVLPAAMTNVPMALDPAALRTVRWTPDPLLWLVPFTGATGTYLLASALALGVRHPLRWVTGVVLGFFLALGAIEGTKSLGLLKGATRVLNAVFSGPYGIDALLTARTESLHTVATLTSGQTVEVWHALPHTGQWAAATLLWAAAGLAALWAAASRHGERRRG